MGGAMCSGAGDIEQNRPVKAVNGQYVHRDAGWGALEEEAWVATHDFGSCSIQRCLGAHDEAIPLRRILRPPYLAHGHLSKVMRWSNFPQVKDSNGSAAWLPHDTVTAIPLRATAYLSILMRVRVPGSVSTYKEQPVVFFRLDAGSIPGVREERAVWVAEIHPTTGKRLVEPENLL